MRFLLPAIGGVLALLMLSGCNSASAPAASVIDGPGPKLTVAPEQLEAALSCTPDVVNAHREVVLITPAFSTAEESFSGYLAQLPTLGIPTCSLSLPDHGYADLQNAAEYVVFAIRRIAAESGRKLILFGHQHGPLDQLWALTFWPDLPEKVLSLVSLATPYQGTQAASTVCNTTRNCSPSVWQIAEGSQFLAALNARPLPTGVAVTSITTLFDQVIVPQPSASRREGATNLILQDLCPFHPVEHFRILSDNLTYALVLDAITHPGEPPDPARLPAGICTGPSTMPQPPQSAGSGTPSPDGFLTEFPTNNVFEGVSAEPPLRDYAR